MNGGNKRDWRSVNMRKRHGMRPEDWATLYNAQQGLCYLCGKELDDAAVVDHAHDHCGPRNSCRTCQRGLAHDACNTAIGMAGDDPVTLRRMADALEAAQRAYQTRKAEAVTIIQPVLFG